MNEFICIMSKLVFKVQSFAGHGMGLALVQTLLKDMSFEGTFDWYDFSLSHCSFHKQNG